jgi:hypothetical protein
VRIKGGSGVHCFDCFSKLAAPLWWVCDVAVPNLKHHHVLRVL